MPLTQNPWKARFVAAGIHLTLSLCVALLAAGLVFGVWYPYPYREISGGRELFWLVVTVDVILGPLLTFAVFNRRKPLRELRRDLGFIALLQMSALAYGLWTVSAARPVHLVYEVDRFRVVHAIDVPAEMLNRTPEGLKALPLTGPTLLSVRAFKDAQESFDATLVALQGLELSARPDLWQDYEKASQQVMAHARPLGHLKSRFPDRIADIDRALASAASVQRDPPSIGYIPMVSRSTFWTVLIDLQTTKVIAFVPIDSF